MKTWIEDALDSFDYIAKDQNRKDLSNYVTEMRHTYLKESKAWKENNTLLKLKEETEKQKDKDVLKYFNSIPQVGYINENGITVLPSDMR